MAMHKKVETEPVQCYGAVGFERRCAHTSRCRKPSRPGCIEADTHSLQRRTTRRTLLYSTWHPLRPPREPWPTPGNAGWLHSYLMSPATFCCSGSLECQHQRSSIRAVLHTSQLLSKALQDLEADHQNSVNLGP
ncbi:uncharacterized protein LOC119399238 [Rhipicephalus sanguineus]|uniref:uncharacterized protein LOC119399238 n=1 Tax=Rhipicephalus sanguineus TaxID=34632 RepID=UPI00189551B8|nr:uncharacterized protein LOC119399238 [Rhipicephalus sanguineus]